MSSLTDSLAVALADTFAFYLKAQVFHWNVVGPSFPQYHDLFRRLYEDAQGASDDIAEKIRTLDELAPASPKALLEPASVDLESGATDAREMIGDMVKANDAVIASLTGAMAAADEEEKAGISNFLQDRLDRHAKWGWQLKATMDGKRKSKVLYDHERSQ